MFQNFYGYPPQVQNTQITQQGYQQPTELVRVSTIESAKAYKMPANSTQAMFHDSENIMFIKSTDGAGFANLRVFKFEEINTNPVVNEEYVKRTELEEILNRFKADLIPVQTTNKKEVKNNG